MRGGWGKSGKPVGWVERSDTHHAMPAASPDGGYRLCLNPANHCLFGVDLNQPPCFVRVMFKKNTVIIVGAGASAEFGLPTGAGVFLRAHALSEPKRSRNVRGFAYNLGFKWFVESQGDGELQKMYHPFKDRVQSSVTQSIDRLAWLNEDVAPICRAFSAWCIYKDLYKEESHVDESYGQRVTSFRYHKKKTHLQSMVNGRANWVAQCANKWLGDASSWDDIDSDVLTFVTFNYDVVIEEAFSHFVKQTYRFREIDDQLLPKVFHVHGSFDGYPEELQKEHLVSAQSFIKYIEDGGDQEAVRRARIRLERATHVIAVGFDFDEKNVELLNLNRHAKKIHALNYDGNEALDNRLKSLGVSQDQILRGSADSPISVSLAAHRGFFDRAELFGSNYIRTNL
jgi:SIR2-like domain